MVEGDVSCVCVYKMTLTMGVGHSEGYLREPSRVSDSTGGLAGGSTCCTFSFNFEGDWTEEGGVLYLWFEIKDEDDDCMIG